MFNPVSSKVSFPQMEEGILQFWRERNIFRRSVEERQGDPLFVLYEGPPTANGAPGVHHVLARVFKDVIPRFKTMQGYYAPRKGGWDTHGLPVELEIERELGLRTKRDIEEYGIDRFNARCRESVFRYVKDWEAMTDRIAFWVDMDDPYVTFTNDYIESCWWVLKQLWDKDLVYRDYKVTPHCPRCDTSLSSHEVALGYREDTPDPSVHVKLRVRSTEEALATLPPLDTPTYLLAWTTTPWTLPANVALAVAPEARYVVAEGAFGKSSDRERLILAEALADTVLDDSYHVRAVVSGRDLVGIQYEPLYTLVTPDKPAHRVVAADFVSMEDGTGIVHIAPAYGAEDLDLGRLEDLPVVHTVNLNGTVIQAPVSFAGLFVKEADPHITEDLRQRGLLYREGVIRHTYPFCWRCDTPLIYYAKNSWYIRTSALKDRLLSGNEEIHWRPDHIKWGRFGEWLRNNVDWALSRERYWGTPLPVWTCESCAHNICIGGLDELQSQPGLQGYQEEMDLHRPVIDGVSFECPSCGGVVRRELDVLDAWYDSGAMPIAQWHYPFQNGDLFAARFPADYICEAVDQTRGWFYTLHALSTLLFDQPSYRNVICLGLILDEAGEKMSKSRNNVVDPWAVLNRHGADAMRWYMYTATTPGNPRRFSTDLVGETVRRFMLTLWNTYSFFVTYANVDRFDPKSSMPPPFAQRPLLDRWALSALQSLVADVTALLGDYNPTDAGRRIEAFVESLSNWYVRRSRRRFWKTENDADKLSATHTLYDILVTLAKLLAPFTPFVAEEIYRNLVASVDSSAPESVHLAAWPQPEAGFHDATAEEATQVAIRVASLGRAARNRAAVKVRQPLSRLLVVARSTHDRDLLALVEDQLRDELNVKEALAVEDEAAFTEFTVRPNAASLGPRYGRELGRIAAALKELNPADVAAQVRAGRSVEAAGVLLTPNEVLVDSRAREGYAAASEGPHTVAIETTVTAELQEEGLARDIVRHLQELRRKAGLEITDRIIAYIVGDADLASLMDRFGPYIRQETLATAIQVRTPPRGVPRETVRIEGRSIELGLERQAS